MIQYLNHDNRWPRLRTFGLEVDPGTGALTLRKLPGPPRRVGCVPGAAAADSAPAGIVAGPDGTIYLSDPVGHCVYRLHPATGEAVSLACVGCGEQGHEIGQFWEPTGLAFQHCRGRLLVADGGNHRIQVIDPLAGRVVAVYGQTWPFEPPRPSFAFGGLDGPEQLACDRAGGIYVIDRPTELGRRRVLKLDPDGRRLVGFERLAAEAIRKVETSLPDAKKDSVETRYVAVAPWGAAGSACEAVYVLLTFKPQPRLAEKGKNPDPGTVGLALLLLSPEGESLTPTALTLFSLPPQDEDNRGASFVKVVANEDRLRGFAVLGEMAFVGLAGERVGECTLREPDRVWCFHLSPNPGTTVEPSWLPQYSGPVAALGVRAGSGVGSPADLLIHPGPGGEVVALRRGGAYRTQGLFLAGPYTGYRGRATPWHRLRFDGALPPGAHARFFTLSRSAARGEWVAPPLLRSERLPEWYRLERYVDALAAVGFASLEESESPEETTESRPLQPGGDPPVGHRRATPPGLWFAAPDGQLDFLTRNSGGSAKEPAEQLWVFGVFAGDGSTSPVLRQARLEHDEDGWLNDLPAVYQHDPRGREFIRSVLAYFESVFEDVTGEIDRAPALFSASALLGRHGPEGAEDDWLAGCLGLPAPAAGRSAAELIARGPGELARRATPAGLRALVELETAVRLHIDEPGLLDAPLVFGASAEGTALAPVSPDEMPVSRDTPGWPEILGAATVADPARPVVTLPTDLAHHFVARGYAVDLWQSEARIAVERALRRAAPAHATYSLQVIAPRLRVGVQARLGIDAVVGSDHPVDATTLGRAPTPDTQITPSPVAPATVGAAHLGADTTLR